MNSEAGQCREREQDAEKTAALHSRSGIPCLVLGGPRTLQYFTGGNFVMDVGGAYTAERAAALSGVPRSTVHYWARKGYLVPSVSPEKTRLWSFADLMGLRTIYWLRQPKKADGQEIPRTTMTAVRHALAALRMLDLGLFETDHVTVAVTRSGDIVVNDPSVPLHEVGGQLLDREMIDLLLPFRTDEGTFGPNLSRPRDTIRIVPRKLSGSPHVAGTRIETTAIYALHRRGFPIEKIRSLYPVLSGQALSEAVELEDQLSRNLSSRLAA
jgi:DNA-binding transcriptional MerR regulator